MSLSFDTELDVRVSTSDGDHDVYAHYVEKDQITDAVVNGYPVVALCGKIWIPHRDPEKYPVCPECKEIYESIQHGD
jgi:hypothetical protein